MQPFAFSKALHRRCYVRIRNRLMVHLTTILLTTMFLQTSGANSQTITLSMKNAPLEKVFAEIQKQTGYNFVYRWEILENSKKIDLNVVNSNIREVLEICLKEQPLIYKIVDRTIIINGKTQKQTPENITVTGLVTDKMNAPLQGATVKVKDGSTTTITNESGEFVIKNIDSYSTLEITYAGYEKQEIELNGRRLVYVKMDIRALDETIVKGYYNTTRRLNTGTVSKVSGEELRSQPVSNPIAALQGRVPGLLITQANGLPGSNFSILLRGRNSIQSGNNPLFIIDGVPFSSTALTQLTGSLNSNNPFNTINPADIESIEVLKDADATAIYGSRGANGVILINTKKNNQARSSLSANVYTGWGKITNSTKYMNTQQYLEMRKEAFKNDGVTPTIANAPDLVAWDQNRYTDWTDELIGGTARTTNANVSYSGGSANTNFSLSAGYYKETTVFPADLYGKRNSINLNVNHRSQDNRFNLSFTGNYSIDKSNLSRNDVAAYVRVAPNSPPLYDATGRLIWKENGATVTNPAAYFLQQYNCSTELLNVRTLLSYLLVKNLVLKTSLGYARTRVDEENYTPIASQNPDFNPRGAADFANNSSRSLILEPMIEYSSNSARIIKHEMTVGSTMQNTTNNLSMVSGIGYTTDVLLKSIRGATTVINSRGYSQYRYNAIFARYNFNYRNKYLLNLTARRDGSSRFGPDNQFANFGATGAAWIFSEEPFVKEKLSFLSFGKIKASYGITGNDQVGDYKYLDTYTASSFTYQGQVGLSPTQLFNADYSWERVSKLELGLNIGFFQDRILLNTDLFQSRSDNQVISYAVPAQTGFTTVLKNFPGIIENKGIEFQLTTVNIRKKNFEWTSSANLSVQRNKLVEFPQLERSAYANTLVVGQPLDVSRGYHYLGIDPQTGIYKFEDRNKDGLVNNLDYKVIGTINPDFFGGFGNNIRFKNFDFNFFFYYIKQKGRDLIYGSAAPIGGFVNAPVGATERWKNPGDVSKYQKYSQGFGNAFLAAINVNSSDQLLTDLSFIRLKSLSISYTLSPTIAKMIKTRKCRVYVEGQNLLTFTGFEGADPESRPGALPPLKMFAAGIEINL